MLPTHHTITIILIIDYGRNITKVGDLIQPTTININHTHTCPCKRKQLKALGGRVLGSTDAISGYPSTLELVSTNITSITTTVEHQNCTLCPISSRPSPRFEKPTPKTTLFNYADPTGREGGSGDADFDYLSNFLEYCEGLYPSHSIDLVNFNGGPYQKDFFPNAHDWDLDGMFDGYEVLMALKAKDNGTLYPEFGPSGNPDGDGFDLDLNGIIEGEENLTNLEEFLIFHDNGTNRWYVGPSLGESEYINEVWMDPWDDDTDYDKLPDGWEDYYHKPFAIDPTSADSDGDGDSDWEEDSDWDGYSIGTGKLLTNWQEYNIEIESTGQFSHSYHMNPISSDSDDDGMWDGWELHWEFDPTNASDADSDPDGDGYSGDPFTNFEEFLNNSYPKELSSLGITLEMARDTDDDRLKYNVRKI